jgi:hypothetical protein
MLLSAVMLKGLPQNAAFCATQYRVEAKKATQIGGSQYQLRDPGYWIVGADTLFESVVLPAA